MNTTLPSSIADKPELDTSFTSTGAKLFFHQEAMQALRDGKGMPISAWCAPTDICNHKCAFCSVGERVGDVLRFTQITDFIDQLVPLGLKSITFSGGGNPLIYKCKETGKTIEDVIRYAYGRGLECAMITNGMPLKEYRKYPDGNSKLPWREIPDKLDGVVMGRTSWKNMCPEVLDMLTWCRISMSGLDHNHKEQEVFVPDFDPTKTSLGFSWIMSDSYAEPTHKHGWVSTPEDVKSGAGEFVDARTRLPWIEEQIGKYVEKYHPRYVRLLCNCLQPDLIPARHAILQGMAERINPEIVFSQNKPPRQPKKCFKILTRPCLNACGGVFACDSVVLNQSAGHQFQNIWKVCDWHQVGDLMLHPEKYIMPDQICAGCVFSDAVDLIHDIVHGMETPLPDGPAPQHVNYI